MPRLSACLLLALLVAALPASRSARAADTEPAEAAGFQLDFPLACGVGKDCWIIQYVDEGGGTDYNCGKRSYGGHNGTDIGIGTLANQAATRVVAAAPGRVAGLRDDVPDAFYDPRQPGETAGKECGNGVRLDHGGGWMTTYCHMEHGSLTVRPGQMVAAGDVLGQVGLSGGTQFPHVHLGVYKDGKAVDPYTGLPPPTPATPPAATTCGPRPGQLWSKRAAALVGYSPIDIIATGFATRVPETAAVLEGKFAATTLAPDAAALVLWTMVDGGRAGDKVTLRLLAPEGAALAEQTTTLEKDQMQILRAVGRRRQGERWPAGEYRGEVVVETAGTANAPAVERRDGRVLTVTAPQTP